MVCHWVALKGSLTAVKLVALLVRETAGTKAGPRVVRKDSHWAELKVADLAVRRASRWAATKVGW